MIINTSAITADLPELVRPTYSMSKGAVNALTLNIAAFLVSDDAGFITWGTIVVDSGLTARYRNYADELVSCSRSSHTPRRDRPLLPDHVCDAILDWIATPPVWNRHRRIATLRWPRPQSH